MFSKTHKPHVLLVNIVSSDTYEVVGEFRSTQAALHYVHLHYKTHSRGLNDLRVIEYIGRNLWVFHQVARDDTFVAVKQMQLPFGS